MIFKTFARITAACVFIAPAFGSSITTLPPYSFFGQGYGPSTTVPGTYTINNPGGANYGVTSYGVALTPSPSVSASSRSAADVNAAEANSNSFASLEYFVQVDGPTSTVQVQFSGLGMVSGSFSQPGNDQDTFIGVDAQLGISGLFTDDTNITITDSGGSSENGFAPSISDGSFNSSGTPAGGYTGSFSDTRVFTLNTGQGYQVNLQVKANTLSQGVGMSAIATAFVDPTFVIAGGVANASQYSFTFSPGIGNDLSSTPEPGTWIIAGSGLLLLAGVRRRMKKFAL